MQYSLSRLGNVKHTPSVKTQNGAAHHMRAPFCYNVLQHYTLIGNRNYYRHSLRHRTHVYTQRAITNK